MNLFLEGALGVPLDHPAAPALVTLKSGSGGFTAAMRSALSFREPMLLEAKDKTFESGLFEGIEWRGFQVPSSQILVCPIRSMADDIVGFLIIGEGLILTSQYTRSHLNRPKSQKHIR